MNADVERHLLHVEEEPRELPTGDRGPKRYEVTDPVLVLGREPGDVAWAGVTPAFGEALTRLMNAPQFRAPVAELRRHITGDDEWDDVMRGLRRDSAVTRFDGPEAVKLLVHPQLVFEASASRLEERVERQLSEGRLGGRSDYSYLTASLVLVKGWIDAAELLDRPADARLYLRALAEKLVAGGHVTLTAPPDIALGDANVDRERLAELRAAMRIARIDTLSSETGTELPEGIRLVNDGDEALLYADVIASGESIRRCVSRVLRDGGRPVVVACLLDARADGGEPLDVWGETVPVVSLVQRSTAVEGQPGRKVYLDAKGNIERAQLAPTYPLDPGVVLTLAETRTALHFGHVSGSSGRHFTFYVNAEALLGRELFGALIGVYEAWRASATPRDQRVEIWHPTPEPKRSSPARRLAEALHATDHAIARTVAVPRIPVWGGWRLPQEFHAADETKGRDVVILDWGALEGTTVTEMMRLAGQAGASRVLVCVCLAQLAAELERHLTSLERFQAMYRPPPSSLEDLVAEIEPTPHDAPVEIHFLSSLAVRAYTPAECPVCQQLTLLDRDRPPTPLLTDFVKSQRKNRRLVRHDDLTSGALTDFAGEPLSGSATVAMLRFRTALEDALHSMRRREALRDELVGYAGRCEPDKPGSEPPEEAAVDFVRLLGSESQWLRRPPLMFKELRNAVATIAAAVALCNELTSSDRASGIIVLRTCSKRAFAQHADRIYESGHADSGLVAQLLYGVYTYLERPYLRGLDVWQPLHEAVAAMRERIKRGELPLRTPGARDIEVLASRAAARVERGKLSDLRMSEVWADLRWHVFGADYDTHGIAAAAELLHPVTTRRNAARFLRDEGTRVDDYGLDAFTRHLLEQWAGVERFLGDRVMPRLEHLSPVLDSAFTEEILAPQLATVLRDTALNGISVSEWPIAQLVSDVEHGRRSFADRHTWNEFESGCLELIDGLLRPAITYGGAPIAPSRLLQLLDSVPAPLHAVVSEVCERHRRREASQIEEIDVRVPEDGTKVFFPQASLRKFVAEALRNVEDHSISRSAAPGMPLPSARVVIQSRIQDATVTLRIENTASEPSDEPGSFLTLEGDEIRCFGGRLDRVPRPAADESVMPGSTYAVEATFELYDS